MAWPEPSSEGARCIISAGLPEALVPLLRDALARSGRSLQHIREGPGDLLAAVATGKPDAILVGDGLAGDMVAQVVPLVRRMSPSSVLVALLENPFGSRAKALIAAGAHEVAVADAATVEHIEDLIARGRVRLDHIRRLEAEGLADPLTGLLNRRGFWRWAEPLLRYADRTGTCALLLLVDLDRLKQINDRYGHRTGDHALCLAAHAMRAALRASDAVARIGGDEFAALALGAAEMDAPLIAERIRAELASTMRRSSKESISGATVPCPVTVTLGWAVYLAGSGISLDALMDAADVHLYAEKAARGAHNEVDSG